MTCRPGMQTEAWLSLWGTHSIRALKTEDGQQFNPKLRPSYLVYAQAMGSALVVAMGGVLCMRLFKRRKRWRFGSASNLPAWGHRRVTSLNSFGSLANLSGSTGDSACRQLPTSIEWIADHPGTCKLVCGCCKVLITIPMGSGTDLCLCVHPSKWGLCLIPRLGRWTVEYECQQLCHVRACMLCRAGGPGEKGGVLWVQAVFSGGHLWQQGQAGSAGQPAEVCHSERDRKGRVVETVDPASCWTHASAGKTWWFGCTACCFT